MGLRPLVARVFRLGKGDAVSLAILATLPMLIFGIPALAGHPVLLGDDMTQNYPLRVLVGEQLRAGHLPLYNPYIWSGAPLLGGWNAAAAYPLTWLFAILPGVAAWTAGLIVTWLTAGLGMFCFLRALGLRPLAGFLGGLSFAFAGAMPAQVSHFGLVSGMSWVPVALLAVLRLSQDRRRVGWTAALAVAVGMIILAGEPRAIDDALVIIVAYAAWRIIRLGRRCVVPAAVVIAGLALGVFLGAVQWLPGLDVIRTSQRAAGSMALFSSGSLPVRWLPLTLVPDLLGGSGSLGQPGFFGSYNLTEVTGYVGILPLVAAFALLARTRLRPRLPEWTIWHVIGIVGVVLSLGGNTVAGDLLYRLPLFGGQRLQSRNLLVLDFALAVLLAFWADRPAPALRSRFRVSPETLLACVPALGAVVVMVLGLTWAPGFMRWLGVSAAPGVVADVRPWLVPYGLLGAAAIVLVVVARSRPRLLAVFVVCDVVVFTVLCVVAIRPGAGRPGQAVASGAVAGARSAAAGAPRSGPTAAAPAAPAARPTPSASGASGASANAGYAPLTHVPSSSAAAASASAGAPRAGVPRAGVPGVSTSSASASPGGASSGGGSPADGFAGGGSSSGGPAGGGGAGGGAAGGGAAGGAAGAASSAGAATRTIAALGYHGRFAIYDPGLLDSSQLSELNPPDLNGAGPQTMPSIQGYTSLADGRYAAATGTHLATGQGQNVLSPRAIANGTLDQLDTSILLTLPAYLTSPGGAGGSASLSGAGSRTVAAGQHATWYLGASLAATKVEVADTNARQDATATRLGLTAPDGVIRWFRARAVSATTLAITLARPAAAVAVTGLTRAGTRLGPPHVVTAGGAEMTANGQLQNALVPPHWRFAGFDGSFAVFSNRAASKPLTIVGAGAAGHPSAAHPKVTAVSGTATEPTEAAVFSPHGAQVIRSVAAIPGWSATWRPAHGQPTSLPVQRRGLIQAVDVPAGRGLLTWRYTPPGFAAGLLLSVIATTTVFALSLVTYCARRRTR